MSVLEVSTVESDAVDLGQAITQSTRVAHFVLKDRLHAAPSGDPSLRGEQTGDAHCVDGAEFHPPRIVLRLGFERAHDTGSPGPTRGDVHVLADVHPAGAGGSEERFVTGETDHVDVHRSHIDWHQARGLGGVDGKENPPLPTHTADLRHRLDRSDDV